MNMDLHMIIVEIVGIIIAAGFGYVKSLQIKDTKLNAMKTKAVDIIDTAVARTYNDFVRDLKQFNADGKLTAEEKEEAMASAKFRAADLAQAAGIDLFKVLGTDILDYFINRSVQEQKGK